MNTCHTNKCHGFVNLNSFQAVSSEAGQQVAILATFASGISTI
jgi:hypothetical protein